MPAAMPSPSRRLLLSLFLVACGAGLVFSITGNGGSRTKEAGNGEAKVRVLRGLDTLGLRQKQRHAHGRGVSPAPAPARASLPLLHKDARRLPVPGKVAHDHKTGNNATAPSQRQSPPHGEGGDGERGSKKKKSMQLVVAAAAAALSGAALVLLAVLVVFLTCRKFQGKRGGAADLNAGTNKVSFEPAPGMFYLDAIKPYLDDAGSDGGGKAAPEMAGPKDEELKCEEDGGGACSDDGADSVHSSCCFHSSHFSYSELTKADGVSPSPSVRSKRRGSAPTTPWDKSKAASPFSPLGPRTPRSEDRGRRAHSPSSSASVVTSQSLNDHELRGTAQSVRSLKFQSGSAFRAKEEVDVDTVSSNAASSKPVPPPPPPPRLPPVMVKQQESVLTGRGDPTVPPPPPPPPPLMLPQRQSVETSCGGPAVPTPPPPPPALLVPQRHNGQRNGGTGPALPPPPAPPGLFRPSAPPVVGENGAPLPKLKPLHWDKVRAAPNRRMVWDRIRSSSFELDEQMIESLFRYTAARCSAKHEEAQSRSPSLGHHVLDPKRLQNITILMKAVNATAEQIYAALMHGNGLSVQQLEALIKMAPTKEEVDKLESYDGDVGSLVAAERLLKVVLTIPCAFARVEAMLCRETFADEVSHIRRSFEMLEDACRELMSSKLFLKLLEAVLKTGNRMNVGTARGGAMAFKLDTLLKLADVKGADGRTTLLHFVVQEMIRSSQKPAARAAEAPPDIVTGLAAELTSVRKTATVDLDVLTTSVSGLSHGLSRIRALVGADLAGDERGRCFVALMAPFVAQAGEVIRELEDGERRVLAHVRDITEYYHGDVGRDEASPLRIFVIVRDFLAMLERVCKEVRGASRGCCHGPNGAPSNTV
ncbi:formin-like protein 2 [Panicum virgatum]|uniref:Formin-like protein n=1 Tax=Panicum virgatum TaxID=38727 RepID=A0A8T0PYH4_PANVG|nr:formin-like protein 2 [Panicum virgatum]KAG2566700.1 hypothetical protein PVAP13_7NG175400 [Panicum virgatum]KAG2566701.1 hypothetical protein PVAP13_7NG175400 [Panicum virgatum]